MVEPKSEYNRTTDKGRQSKSRRLLGSGPGVLHSVPERRASS